MLVEEMNAKIVKEYGKDLYGNPNYRIVWSTSQFEHRLGTFEDYYGSVYLRTVTEVRQVPKYPLYEDFWIFEKIQLNTSNPEIKAKLSYEPIWVFRNGKGERLQPEWWAVEVIVQSDRAIKALRMNQNDLDAQEELAKAREKMKFKMMLQNESPIIPSMVHNGAGIFVPSTYEKESK